MIQKRIKVLSDEIEDMKRVRETTRKKRSESATMTVAIVGYTNAGKSTLLNKVTDAGILRKTSFLPHWIPPPEPRCCRTDSRCC